MREGVDHIPPPMGCAKHGAKDQDGDAAAQGQEKLRAGSFWGERVARGRITSPPRWAAARHVRVLGGCVSS